MVKQDFFFDFRVSGLGQSVNFSHLSFSKVWKKMDSLEHTPEDIEQSDMSTWSVIIPKIFWLPGGKNGLVECVGQDHFGNKYYEDYDTESKFQSKILRYSEK